MLTAVSNLPSILLIEPKKDLARKFQDLLAKSCSTTPDSQIVSSLQEGLDVLGSRGISLVLMDLELPDSTGPDAVRILRAVAPHSAVIVFAESGYTDSPLEAVQAGAHGLLSSLLASPQELELAIQAALIRVSSSKVATETLPSPLPTAISPTPLPKLIHDLNNPGFRSSDGLRGRLSACGVTVGQPIP